MWNEWKLRATKDLRVFTELYAMGFRNVKRIRLYVIVPTKQKTPRFCYVNSEQTLSLPRNDLPTEWQRAASFTQEEFGDWDFSNRLQALLEENTIRNTSSNRFSVVISFLNLKTNCYGWKSLIWYSSWLFPILSDLTLSMSYNPRAHSHSWLFCDKIAQTCRFVT